MKQFSLDEYLANPSRKVVTRDGRSVRIHCTNHWTDYNETPMPIVAEIQGIGFSESFTEDGKYYTNTCESKRDLFFASEKHEGWINIYSTLTTGAIYDSEEEARKMANPYCIATIKIEWED